MIDLFTVPAGTKITEGPSGLLIFNPPNASPFSVRLVSEGGQIVVIKTEFAPDCKFEITIGHA